MTDRDTGMKTRREVLGDEHVDRATAAATRLRPAVSGVHHRLRVGGGVVAARPRPPRRAARSRSPRWSACAPRTSSRCTSGRRCATASPPEEIREVLLHTAVYAGVPAANSAFAHRQAGAARRGRDRVARSAAERRSARGRSAITSGSCVAQMTVWRPRSRRRPAAPATRARVAPSSREVGSSTISSPRALASARASATRWASPADSRATRWRCALGEADPGEHHRGALGRLALHRQPRSRSASTTFSSALRKPTGEGSWGR